MPTEAEVTQWCLTNWPSGAVIVVFSMVYVRLHRLLQRLETAEKDASLALKLVQRLVKTHLKRHGEDIEKLMPDERKEGEE